jgi:hypothetical protein
MRQCRATKGALMGALMSVATMVPPPILSATPGLTATEFKAVFLLRLPQFVTWPDGQVADVFCVAEAPEISRLLAEMLVDDDRGRVVRELGPSETTTGCDVVFGNDATLLPAGVAVRPMLRVNDQPGYARGGGMVELQRRGARIGLVVNLPALESVGLKASSKLLQLSDVIGGADGS